MLFTVTYTACYTDKDHLHPELWHFNQEALQRYVLYCCQSPQGGLLDKPGKTRDFYHTCYCLSGLSLSQHCFADSKTINVTEDDGCVLVSKNLNNLKVLRVLSIATGCDF